MSEFGKRPEHAPLLEYKLYSQSDLNKLINNLEIGINTIGDGREEQDPDIAMLVNILEDALHDIKTVIIPTNLQEAEVFVQAIEEVQNIIIQSSQPAFLNTHDEAIVKKYKQNINELLKRAEETCIYFLEREMRNEQDEKKKKRMRDRKRTISKRLEQRKLNVYSDSDKRGILPREVRKVIDSDAASEQHGSGDSDDSNEPRNGAAQVRILEGGPRPKKIPQGTQDDLSNSTPPQYRSAAPKKAAQPSMPSTGGWGQKALVGFAALAGFFGVKIGFEKAMPAAAETTEVASDALESYAGGKMSKFPHAHFDQQSSEQPDTEKEQSENEPETLTRTYTVKPADTLWGYAGKLIDTIGVEDPNGIITLEAVKKLREANGIQGDAAKSKKMWVGQTIDVTSAYDFVVSQKTPDALQSIDEDRSQDAADGTHSSLDTSNTSHATADTLPSTPDSHNFSPELSQHFSPDLLSSTLTYPSETIWSRTHDMIECLGMKPNIAKRGVLGAIVLMDSRMSEAQATRVKYAGHEKFDATKDTLNFTRAAQAALDLKNGMSPGDVAKKYGVKNVYEKLRDR